MDEVKQPNPAMPQTEFVYTNPEALKKEIRKIRILSPVKWVLGIGFAALGVYLLIAFIIPFIEPGSRPQSLKVSNVGDQQAALSWTTQKPTRDLVLVSKEDSFPIFPIFAQKKYIDDGDRGLGKQGFYTAHQVTIDNLKPEKTYYFRIYQGVNEVHKGDFKTGPSFALSSPNPVYGQIIGNDNKPIAGAIVYFRVFRGGEKSGLLSTLTNGKGGWSVDLGNLRSEDLQKKYEIQGDESEEIVVEGGVRGRVKRIDKFRKESPRSKIVLPRKEND